MPGLSQPRVVATRAGNVSCGSSAPSVFWLSRFLPKIWPIWKAGAAGHADNSPEMVGLVRAALEPRYGAWRRFDEFLALNVAGMIRWRAEGH